MKQDLIKNCIFKLKSKLVFKQDNDIILHIGTDFFCIPF